MSYIQTLSGKKFNYQNATIDDIDIEDIATALSHICRFAGHLPEFYSMAQHSVLVSQILALTDMKPAIGQRTGKNDKTHWITFVKD